LPELSVEEDENQLAKLQLLLVLPELLLKSTPPPPSVDQRRRGRGCNNLSSHR
jgi:hypothetical protein